MPSKTWTLLDAEQNVYTERAAIFPGSVGGKAMGYSVVKRTLRGGLRDGVDVIEVDNGTFRFVVVPTRGMGIWRAGLNDLDLGWNSPVQGPVHPGFVRLWEPSGIGWLDGFDEMLVRCGLESNGAPEFHDNGALQYPLHGKIANRPAHKVEVTVDGDSGEISVTGVVDEARLFGNSLRMTTTYTTRVGEPGVTVTDQIENISAEPSELELLYHINFGTGFSPAGGTGSSPAGGTGFSPAGGTGLLGPGSKVVLPVAKVAPRDEVAVGNLDEWDTYGPETPGSSEAVFFFDLAARYDGQTQTLLRNAAGDRGVSLTFNKNELPCFTLWKNRQAAADGYVTGMEPAINFPNVKSFEKEKGRVAVLEPGQSRSFTITLQAHADAQSVATAEEAIAELQGSSTPEVLDRPNPEWSA